MVCSGESFVIILSAALFYNAETGLLLNFKLHFEEKLTLVVLIFFVLIFDNSIIDLITHFMICYSANMDDSGSISQETIEILTGGQKFATDPTTHQKWICLMRAMGIDGVLTPWGKDAALSGDIEAARQPSW